MTIPKYYEIQPYILKLLNDGIPRRSKEMEIDLANDFSLTNEEIAQEYSSKNGKIFLDRIMWALSYLSMAGLVSKPKRGLYQINDDGRKMLSVSEKDFRSLIVKRLVNRNATQYKSSEDDAEKRTVSNDTTPEESLIESYHGIKASVCRDILDTILSKSPRDFENLVVYILQKMGYGDKVVSSGVVTQYSNDKGIDGIVKEDVLGFGRILIQAKRYNADNNISREDVQKFVGALTGQSEKGVFITTSDFTKGAYEYAEKLGSQAKIVLINGQRLSEYIYEFNVGMQTEKVIEIKKLDSDFWDAMQDENA